MKSENRFSTIISRGSLLTLAGIIHPTGLDSAERAIGNSETLTNSSIFFLCRVYSKSTLSTSLLDRPWQAHTSLGLVRERNWGREMEELAGRVQIWNIRSTGSRSREISNDLVLRETYIESSNGIYVLRDPPAARLIYYLWMNIKTTQHTLSQ